MEDDIQTSGRSGFHYGLYRVGFLDTIVIT